MITIYINQRYGKRIGQNRIGEALGTVAPNCCQKRRTTTARLTKPHSYRADYFCYTLRIDQNQKLVMCGVVHVVAIDDHSRAGTTLSVKNSVKIYRNICRYFITKNYCTNLL